MRDDLKALADGELDAESAAAVERAAAENAELQAELREFRDIGAVLRQEVVRPRSRGMEETLLAVFPPPKRPVPYGQRQRIWQMVIGGACFLLFGFIAFFPQVFNPNLQEHWADASDRRPTETAAAPLEATEPAPETSDKPPGALSADPPMVAKSMPEGTQLVPPAPVQIPQGGLAPPTSLRGDLAPMPLPPVTADAMAPPPEIAASEPARPASGSLEERIQTVAKDFGAETATRAPAAAAKAAERTLIYAVPKGRADAFVARLRAVVGDQGRVSAPIDPLEGNERSMRADLETARTSDEIETEIQALERKRAEALVDFLESSPVVKEIDGQLADKRKEREAALAQEKRQAQLDRRFVQITLRATPR